MDKEFEMLKGILDMLSAPLIGKGALQPPKVEFLRNTMIRKVLEEDIRNQDYTRIQKLFEGGHISNEQLADMVDKDRGIHVDFTEMIYYDMKSLLSEKIVADPALNELFVSIYSKKYNKGYQIAQDGIKNGSESIKKKVVALNSGERSFCLYMFLYLNGDDAPIEKIMGSGLFDFWQMEAMLETNMLSSDLVYNIEQYQKLTFSETEDSILGSKQLDRFISKRVDEIAEYFGITVEEIVDTITSGMNFAVDTPKENSVFGLAKQTSRFVLMNSHGGLCWLSNLAGNRPGRNYNYQPNVYNIVTMYYTVQAILMYNRSMTSTGRFTKLDLSRGWVSDPERDVQNICYMYCLDVFYKLFSEMMKEYYRTFSWEKITSENMQQRYSEMANELSLIIEEQKNQIASLNRQISSLKARPSEDSKGKKDETAVEYERQNAKLIKELEKKDSEIVRLKDYIKSQEEFLTLQNTIEPEEAPVVNLENLQAKKYLFVGNAKEALPVLRKKFAGSILMESETTDISNISVDAIVFLTKWMSHAMFYKVKKSSIYQKVPSAMCNTKNIDRILFDMERQLSWD